MPKVGELLRDERERQGITLRDIEAATSIRLRYLQAIESSDYSALPGNVYAKGFVRNYAITLGLNETEFVGMYKLELEVNASQKQEDTVVAPGAPPARPAVKETRAAHKTPPANKDEENMELEKLFLPPREQIQSRKPVAVKKKRIWPFFTLLVLFFSVAGMVVYVLSTFSGGSVPLVNEAPPVSTPASPVAPPQIEPPRRAPVRLSYENNGRIIIIPGDNIVEEITAVVEISGNCWTMVVADRREVYAGILTGGQKMNWQAREELYVKFGNVGAAKMSVNGMPAVLPDAVGPVAELTVSIAR
ncbi:MAG: helix-turn-helix domain-containing protein [Acidaminococcales bacterium]|nr:helix-turn-helix domain-containing protein [Acidaminococcales bacterium]